MARQVPQRGVVSQAAMQHKRKTKRLARMLLLLAMLCWHPLASWANNVQIKPHPGGVKLLMPMATPPSFSVYRLSQPARLVLEFATTRSLQSKMPATWPPGPLVKSSIQVVLREQIRRRKLVLVVYKLRDYQLLLRQGWLELTLIGPVAPQTQQAPPRLARATPPDLTQPRTAPPVRARPRPTPIRPRPAPRVLVARATPRVVPRPQPPRPAPRPRPAPPDDAWLTMIDTAHRRFQRAAQAENTTRHQQTTATQRQNASASQLRAQQLFGMSLLAQRELIPTIGPAPTLPITQQPLMVMEQRIAQAQQNARGQFQRWFPEPERPPTSVVAVAPRPRAITAPRLRPQPPTRRNPAVARASIKQPRLPPGWAAFYERGQKVISRQGLRAMEQLQQRQIVHLSAGQKSHRIQRAAALRAMQRMHSAHLRRERQSEARSTQKGLPPNPRHHKRHMQLFARLQRLPKARRVAIAVPRPRPIPRLRPIPRPPAPARVTPAPRELPPDTTTRPPPGDEPVVASTGPLPTLLDAFRSLVPLARKKPSASKRPSPRNTQSGHTLLSMRFSQSLQTDRILLNLQSPPNAKIVFVLKGQGTRQVILTLKGTQPAGEDAREPIDASMFLSYIRAAKITGYAQGQTTIQIDLNSTIRAKIQRKSGQFIIVFPRYGRSF